MAAERTLEVITAFPYEKLKTVASGVYDADDSKAYTQEMRDLVARCEPSLAEFAGRSVPESVDGGGNPEPESGVASTAEDDPLDNEWAAAIRAIKSGSLPAEEKKAEITRVMAEFVGPSCRSPPESIPAHSLPGLRSAIGLNRAPLKSEGERSGPSSSAGESLSWSSTRIGEWSLATGYRLPPDSDGKGNAGHPLTLQEKAADPFGTVHD